MLLIAISWAAVAMPDAGRVEVEGLVITAVAKSSSFAKVRSVYGGVEVEFTVSAKGGGDAPFLQSLDSVRAVDADGKLLATSGETRLGAANNPQPNRWTVPLVFGGEPPKTVPAVEGVISVATLQWKTATFEAATLKANAVVPIEDGNVKLTVLDFDDGPAEVRFRITTPSKSRHESPISGVRVTLTNGNGKEIPLKQGRRVLRSNGKITDHLLEFRSDKAIAIESLRALRLEIPVPKGPVKSVRFRIPDVPVVDSSARRRFGP